MCGYLSQKIGGQKLYMYTFGHFFRRLRDLMANVFKTKQAIITIIIIIEIVHEVQI